jgi:hypothetical protein
LGSPLTQRIQTGKRGWIPSAGLRAMPNAILASAAYQVLASVDSRTGTTVREM